ncbi:MAG TPA: hypothetical protein VNW97_01010 [Candidatus Saccharimonadales bacterium]|nr:hypothetical protein [Candidatus Saccharimonadales bacterium]
MRTLILRFALFACVLPAVSAQPSQAQQAKSADPAPIPTQIATAKKVFIANAGGECSPFGDTEFTGGPDLAYNEFFSAVKKWGHFTLLTTPADADLVMEIHFTCPVYLDENKQQVDAQLRLVFLDSKTRILLWAITEHSQSAILQGNRDKEFGFAMARLVRDVKSLVLPAAEQPNANK